MPQPRPVFAPEMRGMPAWDAHGRCAFESDNELTKSLVSHELAKSATATITSEALMTAVTSLPTASPSCSTASTVIEATSRKPPASSSTLAMASPELMAVTRAGIWLRALSRMSWAPSA